MAYGTTGWKHSDKFDWGKQSVERPDPPPEGLYEVVVREAAAGLSKKGSEPKISAQLEITGAEDPELRDEKGKKLFDEWLMVPGKAFRVKNFATVAGLMDDLPGSQSHDEVVSFAEKAKGTTLMCYVKHQEYQNHPTARIAYYGTEEPKDDADSNGAGSRKPSSGGGKPSQPTRRGR